METVEVSLLRHVRAKSRLARLSTVDKVVKTKEKPHEKMCPNLWLVVCILRKHFKKNTSGPVIQINNSTNLFPGRDRNRDSVGFLWSKLVATSR